MQEKLCLKCNQTKSISLFSKNKNNKDGVQYYCKPCSSVLTMSSRHTGKHKIYQDANRHFSHLSSIRARAKIKGLPFNLTIEDLAIPEFCPVLGMKLERNLGKKCSSHNSPSLDRIIPSLGYVKGNVIIISTLANRIKQDATSEQIIKVGKFYEQLGTQSSLSTDFSSHL